MYPPKVVFDAFLTWAQHSFHEEVATDFHRAQTFDGYPSKAILRMLRRFPVEKLRLFADVLPRSVWAGHPAAESLIGQLSASDKQIAEEFKQALGHMLQEIQPDISELILRKRRPEVLAVAKNIKKVGLSTMKEFAVKSRYKAEKIEPEVWRLSASKKWGEISVQLDFETTMELCYRVWVYDTSGIPLREHGHYLGDLGIALSSWSINNADECQEKVLKACEFIQWHLAEYEKIMDAL